jgi:dienelactone hydrolase
MRLVGIAVAWLAALRLLAGGAVAWAQLDPSNNFPTAPLSEEVRRAPGDPFRPVTLEVTVLKPEGQGPFPLAVMNHGSAEPGQSPADMPRSRASFQAFYFLSRGYAVVLPMQRGFAESDGHLAPFGCDLVRLGAENAKDIEAVLGAVAYDPEIDASRVVVAGQSFGGWNTLSLGADAPGRIKGLMIFSGGVRTSDCHDQDRALVDGAERLARRTSVPSIWFYAQNDALFPPPLWRAMYQSYTAAGGQAQLVDVGVVGENGHKFTAYGSSLKLWTPAADAFLARLGLPNAVIYPQYLPSAPPPPSRFAPLDDVTAVPYLNEAGRAEYRRFLTYPLPRAFVLSPVGATDQSGGFDPLATALRNCRARYPSCAPYAVDKDVVWTGAAAGPRPFRATVLAGVAKRLYFASSVNLDCSSRGLPPVSVTHPPAHGTATVVPGQGFPSFYPQSAYAPCNTVSVLGSGVVYTPAPGFSGEDAFTIEEVTLDHERRVFPVTISVK